MSKSYRTSKEKYIGHSSTGEKVELTRVTAREKLMPPEFLMFFIRAGIGQSGLTPHEFMLLFRCMELTTMDGMLRVSHRQLAKELQVSRTTVGVAFKSFLAKDIIAGRNGEYIVNPSWAWRGNYDAEYEARAELYQSIKKMTMAHLTTLPSLPLAQPMNNWENETLTG